MGKLICKKHFAAVSTDRCTIIFWKGREYSYYEDTGFLSGVVCIGDISRHRFCKSKSDSIGYLPIISEFFYTLEEYRELKLKEILLLHNEE
jgi:hypothetical protein